MKHIKNNTQDCAAWTSGCKIGPSPLTWITSPVSGKQTLLSTLMEQMDDN